MKHISIFLLALLTSSSFAQSKQTFSGIMDNYYHERMAFYPLEATLNGETKYNHIFPLDITEAYRKQLRDFYQRYQRVIRSIDKKILSEHDRLSYAVLQFELETNLEQLQFPEHLMPINQFWGSMQTFIEFGSGAGAQPFVTKQDYENFLQRISGFKIWCDTAVANMIHGSKAGYVYSPIIYERILQQLSDITQSSPEASIFYMPITNMPSHITGDARNQLTHRYKQAIQEIIIPSFLKLQTCIINNVMPYANQRQGDGIDQIPNGNEYYKAEARYWTTTGMHTDSIYTAGLREVKRIRRAMEDVKRAMNFTGDLNAFFTYCRTNPAFKPYKTDDEVLNAFKMIEQKINPHLENYFKVRPKTPFEIRQVEAYRETTASAEYREGTPDGSRPGIFYVPILDPEEFNIMSMEALFLHEAIPGHHYQLSLQRENENLPHFRRVLIYGAYCEGWALYTESLGNELGLYTQLIQYMGYLTYDIHRAIRLVVDVGLHAKGWTRQQAIQYMLDNEPLSEQRAIAETERYMVAPGQALSYKIGQLKIIELRNTMKQHAGNNFSVAEFHRLMLEDGSLPLEILEDKVNYYLTQQK